MCYPNDVAVAMETHRQRDHALEIEHRLALRTVTALSAPSRRTHPLTHR